MKKETRIAAAKGAAKFGMYFSLISPVLVFILFQTAGMFAEQWSLSSDVAKFFAVVFLIISQFGAIAYAFNIIKKELPVWLYTVAWIAPLVLSLAIIFNAPNLHSIHLQ
jgi:hypothetical protein